MLSSFTSFLPSRLQGVTSKELPRSIVNPNEDQSDDENEPEALAQPENKLKLKDRDGKGPSETFVFVRPPPSMSNHPLNLQVQLVPPNSRLPSGVTNGISRPPTSAASTASGFSTSDRTSLRRTPSNQSQSSSSTFNNSSTTSFASFNSSTTSSGSRRAIIPLYNLQAHNVMTNVIVDAGTDAKIAKFQKRGIELIDLAFLEPVEVWGEKDGRSKDIEVERRMRRESMRSSIDEAGLVVTNLNPGIQGGAVRSMKSTGSFATGGSGIGQITLSVSPSAVSLTSPPTFISPPGERLRGNVSLREDEHLDPSDSRASVRSDTKSFSSPITPTAAPLIDESSAPIPKKNIFGKLFNKKSGVIPSTPSSNFITPTNTSHSSKQTEGLPSFASSLLQSPKTPHMAEQFPENLEESMQLTPIAAPKEKNGRNLRLGGIAAPIKTTLKNNRNRLSGLVNGIPSFSNATSLGTLGIRDERTPQARSSTEKGRDTSPNPSVARSARSRLSWVAKSTTTQSTDSLSVENGSKEADVTITATTPTQPQTMVTPSHLEGTANVKQQQLRPPVLGCQPSFVSSMSSSPPTHLAPVTSPLVTTLSPRMNDVEGILQGQRAMMYVWLVRKWLKKRVSTILGGSEAIAAGMVGGLFAKKKEASASGQDTLGPPPLLYGGVEVRFEWKRAKGKEANRGRRGSRSRRKASGGVGSDEDGNRLGDPSGRLMREEKRKNRMSTGSFATTVSEENGLGLQSSSAGKQVKRDGNDEESDPEDSEIPWVCTLKVRRSAAAASVVSGSVASVIGGRVSPVPSTSFTPGVVPLEPQVLRVKVGTLAPTPHHPKVVAMLKVPFPLPDVEVERMGVIRRDLRSMGFRSTPAGREEDIVEKEPYVGLTLTAEEIKDVVCSTGLWLVVREGIGGVGKVPRKGDGWRIRG